MNDKTKEQLINELQEIQERDFSFTGLFDSKTVMIELIEIIYDKDDQPIDWYIRQINSSFASFLGKTRDELINKKVTSIITKIEDSWLKAFAAVDKTGEEINFENYGVEFDKYYNVIAWKVAKNMVGVSFIDITKKKHAEEALRESEVYLKECNEAKNKFLSIIAHDLRSPINSILGFSNLLLEEVKEKNYNGIEKYAGIINQSSNHAIDLLMNLMEWSRSQTGRMKFNPEHFEMINLIKEVLLLFSDITGQKKISINTTKLPTSALVFADKAMISTVLRNLISNAIKFTQTGGEIIISTKENQNTLKVSVSDNGVGIPETSIEKLFCISENYSTSGTNNEKGTGLGLILCNEFIEKQRGNIWAESEEGKGSTFHFTLPNNAETKENN
ncbi:MAG: PAS domain S-box-containing protein [bacterium]|jgi:PAS domain S-box-containing protein